MKGKHLAMLASLLGITAFLLWLRGRAEPEPPKKTEINVDSNPQGAYIFLDDINVGVTPLMGFDVAAGSHNMRLEMEGYETWSTGFTIQEGQTLDFNAVLDEVVTPPPPPPEYVNITGDVFDSDTSQPISNATIMFTNAHTSTDASGHYMLTVLKGTSGNLVCMASGYSSIVQPITANSNIDVDFAMVRTGPTPPQGLELVNEFLESRTQYVNTFGNRLYATFGDLLKIYDISDPSNIILVSEIPHAGVPVYGGEIEAQIIVSNENAVIVCNPFDDLDKKCSIINAHTLSVTELRFGGYQPVSAQIQGNVAAIFVRPSYASGTNYIYFYDITDASNPVPITTFTINNAMTAQAQWKGDIIAVACRGQCSLFRLESNFSSITPLSSFKFGVEASNSTAYEFILRDNILFISNYYTIDIWDITNPSAPVRLSSYVDQWGNGGKQITLYKNYMINAHHDASVETIDISNLSQPTLIDTHNWRTEGCGAGYYRHLTTHGDYIVMAESYGGICIWDYSNISSPHCVYGKKPTFGAYFSAVYNQGIVNCICDMGLLTVDFSQYPAKFISYDDSYRGRGWRIYQHGNRIYCGCTWSGLQIFDITDPRNPVHKVAYNPPEYIEEVCADDNYVYAGCDAFMNGFRIFNISNLPSGTIVDTNAFKSYMASEVELPKGPTGIQVVGNRLYLSCGTAGIYVFDVTNRASPVQLGNYNDGKNYVRCLVNGNYMYVAEYYAGIHVFDISSGIPVRAGYIELPYPGIGYCAIVKSGNYIYTEAPLKRNNAKKLLKFDVSDPINLVLVDSFDRNSGGWADFKIYGDYLLMPREAYGVKLYKFVPK